MGSLGHLPRGGGWREHAHCPLSRGPGPALGRPPVWSCSGPLGAVLARLQPTRTRRKTRRENPTQSLAPEHSNYSVTLGCVFPYPICGPFRAPALRATCGVSPAVLAQGSRGAVASLATDHFQPRAENFLRMCRLLSPQRLVGEPHTVCLGPSRSLVQQMLSVDHMPGYSMCWEYR